MKDRYKIEKQEINVVLTLIDGSTSEGSVFLAPHSKIHGGRQTLEELLEETSYFLPLNDSGGEFFLVGKANLAAILSGKSDERELQFVKRVPARFNVAGLGTLEGDLIMPEVHDFFRVSDYINGSDCEWLRVERGPQIYWINKKAIMEIRVESS
jgi:hypothetical protein